MTQTTKERPEHLVYPDEARINARFQQSQDERLILYGIETRYDGPLTRLNAKCTPSSGGDPYLSTLVHDTQQHQAHVHCSCPAGYHGVLCKHAAFLFDVGCVNVGYQKDATAIRVMDDREFKTFSTWGTLPEWREPSVSSDASEDDA